MGNIIGLAGLISSTEKTQDVSRGSVDKEKVTTKKSPEKYTEKVSKPKHSPDDRSAESWSERLSNLHSSVSLQWPSTSQRVANVYGIARLLGRRVSPRGRGRL